LDACFKTSSKGFWHAWAEFGGDPDRSYGFWPRESNPFFGEPGVVFNPDPHSREKPASEQCISTPTEVDTAVEQWIRDNYDLNSSSDPTKNPDYNIFTNNCYDFVDAVRQKVFDELSRRSSHGK
jgi:hypothetical protein